MTDGEHVPSLQTPHTGYKTARELTQGGSRASRGWDPALLPPPWKRVLGPLGEHAGTPYLVATPYAPPSHWLQPPRISGMFPGGGGV